MFFTHFFRDVSAKQRIKEVSLIRSTSNVQRLFMSKLNSNSGWLEAKNGE